MGGVAQALTDKDFLTATPEDQKAYLSSVDHDFAKASPADQDAYHSHVVLPAVRANSAKMNAQPTDFEKAQSENPIDTEAKNPISRTLSSAGGTVMGGLRSALSHPLDTAKGALESLGDVATLGLTEGSPIGESVRAWANPKTRPTWEQIKSVAPEAIGQGIGNVALGEAAGPAARLTGKGIGKVAGAGLGAVTEPLARVVRDPMTGKVRTPWEIGVDKLLPDPNAPKALPARPIPKGTNYGQFLQDKAATTQAETEARQPVPIAEGPTAPQHEAVRSAQTAVARQNARQFVPVSESPVPAPTTPEGAKLPPLIPPGGAGRLGPGFSGTEGRPATWTNEFVLDQAAKGNREGIAQVARRGLPMPAGARYVMGDVDFPRAVYNPRETTRFTPEGTPIRDVTLPEKGSRKLIQSVGVTSNPREVTKFTAEGNVAPQPPAAIPVAPPASLPVTLKALRKPKVE